MSGVSAHEKAVEQSECGQCDDDVGELADIYNLTDTRINQIRRSAEEKMRNDEETVELLQYLNA